MTLQSRGCQSNLLFIPTTPVKVNQAVLLEYYYSSRRHAADRVHTRTVKHKIGDQPRLGWIGQTGRDLEKGPGVSTDSDDSCCTLSRDRLLAAEPPVSVAPSEPTAAVAVPRSGHEPPPWPSQSA